MPDIAQTAHEMISGMSPALQEGEFVFATTDDPARAALLLPQALASFLEKEGMSLLLAVDLATEHGFSVEMPMRCITLNVYSALDGVGLTAAVASALGEQNIPCNMIAAHHHDHVFVPSELCEKAMNVLKTLQAAAENHA